MTYVYLTRKQVVEIHRRGIKYFGGSLGILNEGLLDSALMRPQQGYYNSLTEEASAFLESPSPPSLTIALPLHLLGDILPHFP